MPIEHVRHYIDRAVDFLQGMDLVKEDGSFRNSAALLAIHSAISYADALRTGLGDEELASDDHGVTVQSLQRLLAERRVADGSGIVHLRELMMNKSRVAYGDRRLDFQATARLVLKAERFAVWADRTGISLKIEGWRRND